MNKEELKKSFGVYTDQIPLLVYAKAYWALLHFIIIFPDICGALESSDGKATGDNYKDWAKRYMADSFLSDEELWDIRCLILHQGRTLGTKRYTNYKFSQPDSNGAILHKNIHSDGSICIDVHMLAGEMQHGLDKWFDEIAKNPNSATSINVENNIKYLVQTESSDKSFGGDIKGFNISISASTSSKP